MKFILFIFLQFVAIQVFAESLNCPCKVVEVTDGDTVYILDQFRSSRKIWLAGIDAPQMQQIYGEKSKQNLIDLVKGQAVLVEYTRRDRQGRIVGKLLKDGRDINLQQIKAGYAWHYKIKADELSKLDHALYNSAETEAKNKKIGLWSISAVPPWEFRSRK